MIYNVWAKIGIYAGASCADQTPGLLSVRPRRPPWTLDKLLAKRSVARASDMNFTTLLGLVFNKRTYQMDLMVLQHFEFNCSVLINICGDFKSKRNVNYLILWNGRASFFIEVIICIYSIIGWIHYFLIHSMRIKSKGIRSINGQPLRSIKDLIAYLPLNLQSIVLRTV